MRFSEKNGSSLCIYLAAARQETKRRNGHLQAERLQFSYRGRLGPCKHRRVVVELQSCDCDPRCNPAQALSLAILSIRSVTSSTALYDWARLRDKTVPPLPPPPAAAMEGRRNSNRGQRIVRLPSSYPLCGSIRPKLGDRRPRLRISPVAAICKVSKTGATCAATLAFVALRTLRIYVSAISTRVDQPLTGRSRRNRYDATNPRRDTATVKQSSESSATKTVLSTAKVARGLSISSSQEQSWKMPQLLHG